MSFSSLYVGATGVVAHNANMQVVANNLANSSTVGYKRADMQFGDLMSQQVATGGAQYDSGSHYVSQMGKGVGISEIRTIFKEGGLENTGTTTDLAIAGNGFFGIRNPGGTGATGASQYTRAGIFRFNNDAYLVNPEGFRLQGYAVDRESGQVATSPSDVQLPYEDVVIDGQTTRVVRSDPRATSSIEMVTNLDHTASDHFTSATNPFFAMLESYNGNLSNASTPFGDSLPAYSSSLDVYDSEGNRQALTVYFDPVATSSLSNAAPGYSYWEYLVALPGSADGSSAFGTSSAGLAGLGVMTFNGQGELVGHSAYSLGGINSSGAGGKSLSAWTPSSFSTDGVPQFDFTYGSNGAAVGTVESVSYDFGISSDSSSWLSGAATAAGVGVNAANLTSLSDMNRDARVSTSFDTGSVTLYQIQDGYSRGYLEYTSVDREGFLNGHFTNGQTEQLYQVSIYRFNSPWGLRRDGNTNFLATEASGAAVDGKADVGGRGTLQQNTLEQSNVEMAEEFAKMIITQRGFQANTKVMTTADSLINTVITTKR
ncbi:MAG: flagellar hook-basal body complex protein [Pseudodesulfovibrio sp.]|nr:flagellar hook-basal body complex protein [Pseudodesulfovibrio sp.]